MIPKLAKSIAHFFVIHNIIEESKEIIYAYGLELLISDVLNTFIFLLVALITHTLHSAFIFIVTFMLLRHSVGGYHAKSHLSCMFTLVIVMLVFSYGICCVSEKVAQMLSYSFIAIALPIIICIAPVPHPNKPISQEKGRRLRKQSIILTNALSIVVIVLIIFQCFKTSLYVSSGILLSSIMALFGRFLNRGDNSKRR